MDARAAEVLVKLATNETTKIEMQIGTLIQRTRLLQDEHRKAREYLQNLRQQQREICRQGQPAALYGVMHSAIHEQQQLLMNLHQQISALKNRQREAIRHLGDAHKKLQACHLADSRAKHQQELRHVKQEQSQLDDMYASNMSKKGHS